jgi:hypothetical protein
MSETDERVREGFEHLQTAALELIAAARVLLDLAEDVVRDPTDLIARANAAAAHMARTAPAPPSRSDDDGVERIRVV